MRLMRSWGIKRLPSITPKASAKARVTVQALMNLSGALHMTLRDGTLRKRGIWLSPCLLSAAHFAPPNFYRRFLRSFAKFLCLVACFLQQCFNFKMPHLVLFRVLMRSQVPHPVFKWNSWKLKKENKREKSKVVLGKLSSFQLIAIKCSLLGIERGV